MMTLAEVPQATKIFLDANIFVYHFSGPTPLTPACSALLRRIEEDDLTGYTSLIAVVEVLHRCMIIEATTVLQVEARQAVRYLKEHPAEARQLTGHMVVPEKIRAIGVHILLPTVEDVLASREHEMSLGFLTNDALNLAVMRRHHLSHIATNDPDFQRVASLQVWRPSPPPPSA